MGCPTSHLAAGDAFYTYWTSAADTVSIKYHAGSATRNPVSGIFNFKVFK
jgi:hypothetical protein